MSRIQGLAAAFTVYALAAILLLYRPGVLGGSIYIGHGSDPSLNAWMFRFLPNAIEHFRNPLILHEAWAPFGLNITQATTTPSLALLAWPLTAVLGPIVSFNIVSIATPALAASSAFLFASTYTTRWSAAFLAGWLFGFSTQVFAALLGHPQVDFIAFVPLAFLAVTLRAQGRMTNIGYISLLVAAFVLEFLTSLEIFVTEAIFLGLFTVLTRATLTGGLLRLLRPRADNLLVGLIAAYAITTIIVSPMILTFFADYSQIPHAFQNGGNWPIDLLNLVIPTPVTWLGGHLALPIARRFTGNWSEEMGYIGAPLLVIMALAAGHLRRDPKALPLVGLLATALICTLGPRLHVLGHAMFLLPWALISKLPLLGNALPSRLMAFALLAMSGLAALWIERLDRHRPAALMAVAFGAVFTLPATMIHEKGWWHAPVPTARLFTTHRYRDLIGKGDIVLSLPFISNNGDAMFWQTETDGYFRMTNGYGSFIPAALAVWPAAVMLERDLPTPSFAADFDEFAKANAIREVIAPKAQLAVWDKPLKAAGWIGHTVGQLTVYNWPETSRAAVTVGSPEQARYVFDRQHFHALRRAATCLLRKHIAQIDVKSAIAAGCLDPAFAPQAQPNWDRLGGWLGRYNDAIGIGIFTNSKDAARLASTIRTHAEEIYYPYPKKYQSNAHQVRRGQFLEIVKTNSLLKKNQ